MLIIEKRITYELVHENIKEFKSKHPVLAAVIERGHQMDLKETFAALIVVDVP